MRYRTLGRSGLIVSEICLGTMTFGGDGFWTAIGCQGQDQADALVRGAFDAGVNFFDTANIYSNGVSEMMLGTAIRNLGLRRDELVIATKAHGRVADVLGADASDRDKLEAERRGRALNVNGQSRKHLMDAVDASLERLGLDHIDLYQIHGFDPVTPMEEMLEALDDIVRSGRVHYLGLCNLAAWQVMKALGIQSAKGLSRFQSVQMYYSIAGRDIEREVVPLAQDQGLAILPWSPLAGGFLSGKFSRDGKGPGDARRTVFDFPPVDKVRGFDIIDAMRPIAEAHNASVAQIALAFLLQQGFVTSVIIGAKTQDQLMANLAATGVQLDGAQMQALQEASKLSTEYPGWMLQRMGQDRLSQIS